MKKLLIAGACTLALMGLAQAADKMEAASDAIEHTQEAATHDAKAAQASKEVLKVEPKTDAVKKDDAAVVIVK